MSGLHNCERLLGCLPAAPDYAWKWPEIYAMMPGYAPLMSNTRQDSRWHGEGDVWTHTQMVCEALAAMEEFRALNRRRQQALALAALLHDVGKPGCTVYTAEGIESPGHASLGARIARNMLWKEFGMSGDAECQQLRETVCLLVRYHTLPLHLLENDAHRRARKVAANGALAPDFTLRMLCMLAEADVRGRICSDQKELLDEIELGRALAEEAGCADGPYDFASAHTRRAYLAGREVWPDQPLYDDTWGQVTVMCGLPGTGKDTWIMENCPQLPMVSLDNIRRQMGISPTEEQGAVVQAAREQARVFLRAKQPFVWNATCITPLLRSKIISLCEGYHASVRVVCLETGWEENLRRNRERRHAVPLDALERMLRNLTLPEANEACSVEWICI